MPTPEQQTHAGTDDFSSLFEFLPLGAYRSSPDGRQLRANPALVRLNGFSNEAEQIGAVGDIAGQWYVDPGRRDEFKRVLERDCKVIGFESEVRRYKTRERIWISENAHLVRGADGQVLFYEGTVEEITERVLARQALRDSQQRLRQIVDLVPGMVYRVVLLPDHTRRATFVSSGVRELLGIEPADMLADGMLIHRFRHPEDRARMEAETVAAGLAREPLRAEYRVVLDSGQVKWVQMMSAPGPPEDGYEVRVGVVFDITAEKQAEAMRLERDRAAAADLAKSHFLSRVSHELRTPLNAILGFAQLLELEIDGAGAAGSRQLAWLRQVLASGRHLLALMDDVLDLSSAQTGQLPIHIAPIAIKPVVEEAVAMLAGAAHEAGVSLACGPLADTPVALIVRADRKRLKQILSNLLTNSIKYNRRGGWVRVEAGEAGTMVEIVVADSGPGMDSAQLARLFKPFERLGAQRGAVPGTGLGLALSQQLVEAMGGSIGVDSEPGLGTRFYVRLPQA